MSESSNCQIFISFPECSSKEKSQKIDEVRSLIETNTHAQGLKQLVEFHVRRESPDHQDFGTTLVLVLGTPAALAIAKGIHDFISKYGDQVVIETADGSIVARGSAARNIDVAETVKAMENLLGKKNA